MRKLLWAAAAALLIPLMPASAEARPYGYYGGQGWGGHHNGQLRRAHMDCQRQLRRANSRRAHDRAQRFCDRRIAQAERNAWRNDRRGSWRNDRRRGYRW